MQKETRRVFELFVKKARELKSRNFAKYFENKQSKLGIRGTRQDDDSWVIENVGPDDDAIHAFTPTLRLFIQDEPISLAAMARFTNDSDISQNWKSGFAEARNTTNSYLDKIPNLPFPNGEVPPTRRKIMNTFLNGDFFHLKDPEKRIGFERWETQGLYFVTLNNEFNAIMLVLFKYILRVAELCESELSIK
jgi:hypothetical protein